MVVALVAVVTSVLAVAVNHAVVFSYFAPTVIVRASKIVNFVIMLYKSHITANIEVPSTILG